MFHVCKTIIFVRDKTPVIEIASIVSSLNKLRCFWLSSVSHTGFYRCFPVLGPTGKIRWTPATTNENPSLTEVQKNAQALRVVVDINVAGNCRGQKRNTIFAEMDTQLQKR